MPTRATFGTRPPRGESLISSCDSGSDVVFIGLTFPLQPSYFTTPFERTKLLSRRIEEHGLGCVEGDLVAVGAAGDELDAAAAAAFPDENETVDEAEGASGDVPGEATTSAAAQITGDAFQSAKNKSSNTIRLVTRQEAESNAFSIRDVVLPLVGSDALLPSNSIGASRHPTTKPKI